MDYKFLDQIIQDPELLQMGHSQSQEDKNLGMGWIYYSLARLYRPKRVVCIGSWRGFVPILFAKGIKDNLNTGEVIFIDPSLVDDFWTDELEVNSYFNRFSVDNIKHFRMTTQEFKQSEEYKKLSEVDILFVDGLHTKEQAKFDHQTFEPLLNENGIVLFHDSIQTHLSDIYGDDKKYEYSVNQYMKELSQAGYQVLDLPFEFGLTLVRKAI